HRPSLLRKTEPVLDAGAGARLEWRPNQPGIRAAEQRSGQAMTVFTPAARVARIKPSPSVAAAARAKELRAAGADLVDMTVGEPDSDTPDCVTQAGIDAVPAGDTKYTAVNGTPALRKAIRQRMADRTGIDYGDDQISVGAGAKQIIFVAL